MSCPCIYVMEGDVDDSGGLLIWFSSWLEESWVGDSKGTKPSIGKTCWTKFKYYMDEEKGSPKNM